MKYAPPATTENQTVTHRKSLGSPPFVLHPVDKTVNFWCPQVEEYVMENIISTSIQSGYIKVQQVVI